MSMKVDFQIRANQQDITTLIQDRLLMLRVTDEAGMVSDTVELALDDRDSKIAWPEKQAQLEISLGFEGNGLVLMGTYVVDELEHAGPPAILTIRSKAAHMCALLKSPQTHSWDSLSLGDLVSTIASAHGLSAKVSASLATIELPHLDQTQESDLHLLTRLASGVCQGRCCFSRKKPDAHAEHACRLVNNKIKILLFTSLTIYFILQSVNVDSK